MTREEIEQIIVQNIRTNGRGEITARVMASVLTSFVEYTDSLSADFARLVNAIADAFTVTVEEQEEKFEAAVTSLETRFEGKADELEGKFEDFCTDLLENHFQPWANTLTGNYNTLVENYSTLAQQLAADYQAQLAEQRAHEAALAQDYAGVAQQYETTADGIAEALEIIREGNTEPSDDIIIVEGQKLAYAQLPDWSKVDLSRVAADWSYMFVASNITEAPEIDFTQKSGVTTMRGMFSGCQSLVDASKMKGVFMKVSEYDNVFSNCRNLEILPSDGIKYLIDVVSDQDHPTRTIGPFSSCEKITNLALNFVSELTGTLVLQVDNLFGSCRALENLEMNFDIPAGLDVSFRVSWGNPFGDCTSLLSLPQAWWDRTTTMNYFPPNLTTIPAFDASKVTQWIVGGANYGGSYIENIGAITNINNVTTINLRPCRRLTLQSMVNIANGVAAKTAQDYANITVYVDVYNLMQADTAQYTYDGQTYTGVLAYLSAKGWSVTSSNY